MDDDNSSWPYVDLDDSVKNWRKHILLHQISLDLSHLTNMDFNGYVLGIHIGYIYW